MKKIEMKKNERKVYNYSLKTDPLRNIASRMTTQQRSSAIRTEKSQSRSNFLNLLW